MWYCVLGEEATNTTLVLARLEVDLQSTALEVSTQTITRFNQLGTKGAWN
jgi:hypothetical protein